MLLWSADGSKAQSPLLFSKTLSFLAAPASTLGRGGGATGVGRTTLVPAPRGRWAGRSGVSPARAHSGPRYSDKMATAAVDSAMEVVPALAEEAAPEAAGFGCLVSLPGEVLEYILCSGSLSAADIGRVSSTCRRLRELCQSSGKVWKEQFRVR